MANLTSEQMAGLPAAEIRLHEYYKEMATEGTAVNAVEAAVTLTIAAQPTVGDTMTIANKRYTFVANGTANENGEVNIGTDLATAKTAIIAAINGTDGYNTANVYVTAGTFTVNDLPLTAKVAGALANGYGTTETFTAGGNVFSAATLTGGVNGSIGVPGKIMIDASFLYICKDVNLVSGKNWRKIAHSAL